MLLPRRRSPLLAGVALAGLLATSLVAPGAVASDHAEAEWPKGRSILYVGAMFDQTDLQRLGVGTAGYWFPHFGAQEPADRAPTRERAIDELPDWVAPLNHFWMDEPVDQGCTAQEVLDGCAPTWLFRSFSQDGPSYSKGGQAEWAVLTLPDGRTGRSGAIVDPHTAGASNNTFNRIQLQGDVPERFYLHILTDNTAGEHDPVNRVRARGHLEWIDRGHGPLDVLGLDEDQHVEAPNWLHASHSDHLRFNGVPNLYTYRYEGFQAGDYIKIQLNGADAPASVGGVLFDVTFQPRGPFHPAEPGGWRPHGARGR